MERLADQEIDALLRQAQRTEAPALAIAFRLADEVRRLRGLIADADGVLPDVEKGNLSHEWYAEAEAIRAERGEYWRRCTDCSTEYPCPVPGETRCPKCGSSRFIADGRLPDGSRAQRCVECGEDHGGLRHGECSGRPSDNLDRLVHTCR